MYGGVYVQSLLTALLPRQVPAVTVHADCSIDPCVKDCTDCAPGAGTADPEDCRRYYMCDGSDNLMFPQPLECDEGEVFNPTTHVCEPGTSCTGCTPRCCYDCQDTTYPKISDFRDCNTYYECDATDKPGPPQSCPLENPYYYCNARQTKHSVATATPTATKPM